jgi:hypothetical protein
MRIRIRNLILGTGMRKHKKSEGWETGRTVINERFNIFRRLLIVLYLSVLRIRIRRIRMFLGLLDPDPLVRGVDPDPNLSIIICYENPIPTRFLAPIDFS